VQALCTCVEISPDKTQFARAIQDGSNGTPPPGWQLGTGAFAQVAWLPGGNNDMLHGIDIGFHTAETVLPQGHPLRARMATDALQLVDNVSIAQKGGHEIFLLATAWKITQDPAVQQRYQSSLTGSNLVDVAWMTAGDGIVMAETQADWSGHHLGLTDMIDFGFLGGANPTADEAVWRSAALEGARQGFMNCQAARLGLLSIVAGAAGQAGATDLGKDVLAECPYPKTMGDIDIDQRITSDFCMSPYPNHPWKGDWMTNPGREQALQGLPVFWRGTMDNYWNTSPLDFRASGSQARAPGQDFLLAYWFGRATGQISPNE
jgi:hypothetical protein